MTKKIKLPKLGKTRSVSEIRKAIHEIEDHNTSLLTGELSTIVENAPRALMQLDAEARLSVLYWVLGTKYTSKLKSRHAC